MLLSIAYFPPVEYFALLAESRDVLIDGLEKYCKQSYRNRCRILGANGSMDLRVPVVHNGCYGITEVELEYDTPWVERTEYAIDSAYYSSPFFEYYRDELFALMDSRPETLWELNSSLTSFFCEKIGIRNPGVARDKAEIEAAAAGGDFRNAIHPKKDPIFLTRPYWQVFREKFGFVAGLSVMDLLFNEGPGSLGYLVHKNQS